MTWVIHHSPPVLSTGTTPCARLSLGRSVGQVCRATNGGYPPSFSLSLLGANKEHSNYFGCAVSGWSMRSSPLLHSSLTYSLPFLHTFRISDSQGPLRHCAPQWPNQATNGNGVGVFVGLSLSRRIPKSRGRGGVFTHQERPNAHAWPTDRPDHSFIPSFMIRTGLRSQSVSRTWEKCN